MNVEQLRRALINVPGHLAVYITLPEDEFRSTCLTQARDAVRICKYPEGVQKGEQVLYSDTEPSYAD